jgi:hypothetical protein
VDATLVGVSEAASPGLQVYPNPVRDRLTVRLPQSSDCRVVICDMQGRYLSEQSAAGETSLEVNLQDMPAGLYAISVYSETGIRAGTFVKL